MTRQEEIYFSAVSKQKPYPINGNDVSPYNFAGRHRCKFRRQSHTCADIQPHRHGTEPQQPWGSSEIQSGYLAWPAHCASSFSIHAPQFLQNRLSSRSAWPQCVQYRIVRDDVSADFGLAAGAFCAFQSPAPEMGVP